MPIERTGLQAWLVRLPMRMVDGLRRRLARMTRHRSPGVRIVALTPDARVVLVRHSYAPGWYCPGGGIRKGETARSAALRELREEIGLTGHGDVTCLDAPEESVFVARGVQYRPRLSLEIEAIEAFDPQALPEETTLRTRGIIARAIQSGP